MEYILGISAFYHDSAAALIGDGKVLSAIQEERLTRIKHDASFPKNAIQSIHEDRPVNYTNEIEVVNELENSKNLFKKYNWPIIDVTRKSVEETAASIIKILDILNSE